MASQRIRDYMYIFPRELEWIWGHCHSTQRNIGIITHHGGRLFLQFKLILPKSSLDNARSWMAQRNADL